MTFSETSSVSSHDFNFLILQTIELYHINVRDPSYSSRLTTVYIYFFSPNLWSVLCDLILMSVLLPL